MAGSPGSSERPQSLGEEIANCVSHGLGALAAAAAVPMLVSASLKRETAAFIGTCIFAASMVLLYLVSAIYHALPRSRAKRFFRVLDHVAIYLLIAGTYTPFTLGVLRGAWGWTLFGIIWGLAVFGILLKTVAGVRYHALSTLLYLAMGWLCVIAARPILAHMPLPGVYWLLAGGIAYTAGVVFYVFDERIPYAHFIWHLFVVIGTACHFVAVLHYAA